VSQDLGERSQPGASGVRIGHCNDQPDRLGVPLGQNFSLELCCTELSLEVDQSTLDLDVDGLCRSGQHQVCRAGIAGSHRHLESGVPRAMGSADNGLRQRQLPGVPQPDGRHRVESPTELVSARGRQLASSVEGDVEQPAFSLADLGLARAGQRCEACLAQTRRHSRDPELSSKDGRKVSGPRSSGICRTATEGAHRASVQHQPLSRAYRLISTSRAVTTHESAPCHRDSTQSAQSTRLKASQTGLGLETCCSSTGGTKHPTARRWRAPRPAPAAARRRGRRRPSPRTRPDSQSWPPRSRSRTPRKRRSRRQT
jgi:hypothetical protein